MSRSEQPSVSRWMDPEGNDETALMDMLAQEGIRGMTWSNGPGDRYAAHSHPYNKTIYVLEGSICFVIPGERQLELSAGDRLDLPAQISHSAVVGSQGVRCLEIHH